MAKKLIVFLDMDGVLADWNGALKEIVDDPPEMYEKGFFRNLKPNPGAKEAVAKLLADESLDVYIGSKPTTDKNVHCASEKVEWILEHFPALISKMTLVCDKSLLRGDVLIDDDYDRWAGKFQGEFFHFDQENPEQALAAVVEMLCG